MKAAKKPGAPTRADVFEKAKEFKARPVDPPVGRPNDLKFTFSVDSADKARAFEMWLNGWEGARARLLLTMSKKLEVTTSISEARMRKTLRQLMEGSSLVDRAFLAADRKTVERNWSSEVDAEEREALARAGGNPEEVRYAGTLAVMDTRISGWHDKKFKNKDEARVFLGKIQDRKGITHAVSYEDKGKVFWLIGGWARS